MSKDGKIWLSHTGLENLERCPRCFWLQYKKGIRQPEGIVSRLANRFDVVLKNYFDIYREIGEIPPLVDGKLEGKLQNPFQEKYYVDIDLNYKFYGKLDECLINTQGKLVPVDFKTSSSDPREKETLSAYHAQIDAYLFALKKSGKRVADYGYLVYVFPDKGKLHEGFPMIIHVTKLAGNPERTEQRISKAISVLEGKIPEPSPSCEFCNWHDRVTEEVNSAIDSDLGMPAR